MSDPNDFQEGLLNAIDNIQKDSKFATFHLIPKFFDPQLIVDPCGPIDLPLKDVDASRIIAASHQAPYGKGSETIVNTLVRSTWELNRDQFSLQRRQEWDSFIKNILPHVCEGLGMSGYANSVRAELYKLLLYERGAHFKSHTEYVTEYHGLVCVKAS